MRNHSRSPLRPVTLYFGSRTTSWRVKYEKVELKEWVRVLKTALSSAPEREDTSELEPGPLGAIFAKSLGGVTVSDPCWAICLPQRRKNSTRSEGSAEGLAPGEGSVCQRPWERLGPGYLCGQQ